MKPKRSRRLLPEVIPRALLGLALLLASCGLDTEALLVQGRAKHDAEDYQGAVDLYTQAIDGGATAASAWAMRADALTMLDRFEEAIVDYSTALDREPNPDTYNSRGEAYTWINEHQKAFDDYTQCLALRPDWYTAWSNRGDIYRMVMKDPAKALADYDRALELSPRFCRALAGRSHVLLQLGNDEESRRSQEEFLRHCPTPTGG